MSELNNAPQRNWIKDKNNDVEWINQKEFTLFISESFHYRNSKNFLKVFPKYENDIHNLFQTPFLDLKPTHESEKGKFYRKISTIDINKSLRARLKRISEIHLEVSFMNHYFQDNDNKTKGFDFAYYDEKHNAGLLYEYCFGERSVTNGEELWSEFLNQQEKYSYLSSHVLENSNLGYYNQGENLSPTVIGEIQFANWALAYYDLFKVLHLDNLTGIDLLIYITPTGNLEKSLSSNIVTFKNMKSIIESYSSVLKVPIWLIGIDIVEESFNF